MSKNYGPESSENFSDLLELDLDVTPAKVAAPVAAPAVTVKPVELSPLDKGRALVDGCKTLPELQALAARLNTPSDVDGAWFKALPTATADAIRLAWRAKRDEMGRIEALLRLRVLFPALFGSLAAGIEARPYVWADGLPHAEPAPAPTERQVIATVPANSVSNTGTLTEALVNASTEGAANAAGAVIGSMAGGQMLGVGWREASGYVTALTNGVKRATADEYVRVLRSRFNYTEEQVAALTITIIAESDAPVGKGTIVDASEGMTPAQQRAHMRANNPAAKARKEREEAEKAAKLAKEREEAEAQAERERVMIAGLVAKREGLIVSPGDAWKGFTVPQAKFNDELRKAGFEHLQIGLKTDKALFGTVMRSKLRGNGLIAHAATKTQHDEWPQDVVSRYVVHRLDTSTNLDVAGSKVLVADLVRVVGADDKKSYEVRFYGGTDEIRQRVMQHFQGRKAEKLLDVSDLRPWFKDRVLRHTFHAVKWGGFWLIPGSTEDTKDVETLITAMAEYLGRQIGVGSTTTNEKWSRGIGENLMLEVRKVAKRIEESKAQAADRARAKAVADGVDEAGQEIAARQAVLSDEVARNRLKDLQKLSTLIDGYMGLLGEEEHGKLTAVIKMHREYCEQFLDSTALMMANIEIDADEDDGDEGCDDPSLTSSDDSGEIELELD